MVDTARVVENVGVGAYLGGATLISDPVVLDAAASILTVEARHQTILNVLDLGSAIPQSFDIPLTPSEVLAIAGPFISNCSLPITANPSLTVTNTGPITPSTQLAFSSSAINGSTSNLFCQMIIGGEPAAIALPIGQCVVPQINGPVAIFVTEGNQPLLNNVVDRNEAQIVAGPTLLFVDTQPQMLGMLARTSVGTDSTSNGSSTTSAVQSVTTQTISPAQAESIIQSAATSTALPPATSSTPPTSNVATPADNGTVTINGWDTVPASSVDQ
jgi:hypothetical protein